jgi:hypothetical protein
MSYGWQASSLRSSSAPVLDRVCNMSTDERRKARRLTVPLEGGWQGASGRQPCRIADLSTGGCFVESLTAPAVGEIVNVTISLPDGHRLEAVTEVTYIYPSIGFGARFVNLADRDGQVLTDNLDRLLPE